MSNEPFIKLYLVFERSMEDGYLNESLCDIFSTRERAERDKTERANRRGKEFRRKWDINYTVQEWEIQE